MTEEISEVDRVQAQEVQPRPSLPTLFTSFLRLGVTAFGGPAMIAYIRKMAIGENKWLDPESFQDGVALCQTIPGATAMQMAAYVGLKTRGVRGALCSYVGFGLPAFFIMLGLSYGYRSAHSFPAIIALFSGLQAIIVAIVANAAITFGKNSLKTWQSVLIALVSAALFWLLVNPIFIILLAGILGALLNNRKSSGQSTPVTDHTPHKVMPLLTLMLLAGAGFAVLFVFRRDLFQLGVLISKIDLMAFGGGFASIPLMFREIVEVRSWMDATTFMNGIALGQFTPGPIVITATFVGFMVHGLLGAVVATLAVFLPSFLMLIGVAPWFDRVRSYPWVNRAMGGILGSFVGLLFTVTLRLALHVHWDWPHLAVTAAALAALLFKLDILWVVIAGTAISALAF
jgi:chromate transporter